MLPIIGQRGVEVEPVINIIDPARIGVMVSEMKIAAEFGNTLAKVYPGYYWLVNVDFNGPIATIECGQINTEVKSNMAYKYVLHLTNLFDAGITTRILINSAGELLERAFMRRGKWTGHYPTKVDGVADHHQPDAGEGAG